MRRGRSRLFLLVCFPVLAFGFCAAADEASHDGIDRRWISALPATASMVKQQMLVAFIDQMRFGAKITDDVCGCPISKNGDVLDPLACEPVFKAADESKSHVEALSLIDPSSWAKPMACFRQGAPACRDNHGLMYSGQNCCQKVDPIYNQVGSDLNFYLLMPAPIVEAVKMYKFEETDNMRPLYNSCAVVVDDQRGSWYLAPAWSGYIARLWLYAAKHYSAEAPMALGALKRQSVETPPTKHEIDRAVFMGRAQQGRTQEFTIDFGDGK